MELSLLALLGLDLLVGAKVPWSESSINCFARPTFVGGSESSREGDSIKYEPDDPNIEVFLFTKLILVINRSMFLLCLL